MGQSGQVFRRESGVIPKRHAANARATLVKCREIANVADRCRTLSVLGLAALLPPPFASAHDVYPSRPIHIIVGFTPGAAADITARVLGESMGPILGRQIVVENKPGV